MSDKSPGALYLSPSIHLLHRVPVCRTVARFPTVANKDGYNFCSVGELEALHG